MTPILAPRLGSDRAFERLYRKHVGDVYRYALVVLRNEADAEDVPQTTFLNAYRAYEQGERPQKPQNWLIAIAHNVCRQRFRQSQRRPNEVAFEEELAEAVVVDDAVSAEDIRRALGHLAFNQRAALVMRELEGRSYQEIAEILEVSVSAVETLIFRARRSLAQGLEQPELLKRPKRKGLRRALHAIDLGTFAAAAKTLLAGSAAVKATAAAVAVTAAVTAASVTPKVEGHSPQPARTSAASTPASASTDAPAAAPTSPSAAAFHDELAARPVVGARANATERAPVVQPQARMSGAAAPRPAPVAVAPAAPTEAPAATPHPEAAATPAAAEPAAQAPVAEQPPTAPAPAAQPIHVEPAPVEPAIAEQATPKQRSPYAAPLVPAPEPIAPVITVTPNDVKSSISGPAPEPVVGTAGIVTTPVPAPAAQPSGGISFGGK